MYILIVCCESHLYNDYHEPLKIEQQKENVNSLGVKVQALPFFTRCHCLLDWECYLH